MLTDVEAGGRGYMRKKNVFSEKEADMDLCISPADEHQSISSSLSLTPALLSTDQSPQSTFSPIKPHLLLLSLA